MYIDAWLKFGSTDIGDNGTDEASTDVIDAWGGGVGDTTHVRNIMTGEELTLLMECTETMAGASAEVLVQLVSADDAALTTNRVIHAQRRFDYDGNAFTQATASQTYVIAKTTPGIAQARYVGIWFDKTGTPTAGIVECFLVRDATEPLLGAGHFS